MSNTLGVRRAWRMHRKRGAPTLLLAIGVAAFGCASEADCAVCFAEIEHERIRDTLHRYAIYLDDERSSDFLQLFAPNAVLSVAGFDEYSGREEIRRELLEKEPRLRPWNARSASSPSGLGKHVTLPAVIELEGEDRARAWSDFLRVHVERDGDPSSWVITSVGRYYDRLVKGDDGRWRFARRDVQVSGVPNSTQWAEPGTR